jgi:hypothetical protein
MATLAPPPTGSKKKTAPPAKRGTANPNWMRRLTRSGYFLGAVLFHLILFLLLATWVVFRPPPAPSEDFVKTYVPPAAPPPPPPAQPQETMPVPAQTLANPQSVIVNPAGAQAFNVPLPDLTPTPALTQTATKAMTTAIKAPNNLAARLPAIKAMETQHWGRSMDNIREAAGDPHNVVATFPIFVAQYADGDWDCNLHLEGGQIVAGSMPDLVDKINEWTHGNMKGHVEPTPLDIGGPELAAKGPPFIFFTGHKDFKLTDQEVENLRNYLQDGGCIWGDSALPGEGSRFDIAFRREMKRVIPDIDKNFEPVPITSEIFTKSWFPLDRVPQGMNYYAEPLEHLDIDGKLAILYTPNDYSDMYFMRILAGDTKIQTTYAIPGAPLYTNLLFYRNADVFFRNFTLEGGLGSYRLGLNILGHLLVRFDKELLLAP